MKQFLSAIAFPLVCLMWFPSVAVGGPCDLGTEFNLVNCLAEQGLETPLGDVADFQSQLQGQLTGGESPLTAMTGSGSSCADPDGSKAANGEAYCFEAYFCTAHEAAESAGDAGFDAYDDGKCDAAGGTLIDMTVYVPARDALANAAQAVAGSGSGGAADVSRGKPRCKGCKVERKGNRRDTKPACRGCKVERSTAVGGVRFELTGAADGVCNVGFSPLIVHSHGFGGSKQANLDEPGAQISEQAALRLWREKGYSVVSFSERGFGKSGNRIEMMNPLKEGLDTNEVVDWAIRNLREDIADTAARFAAGLETDDDKSSVMSSADWSQCSILMGDNGRLTTADPDPRLGSTGYSYGGHFQYTATHVPLISDRYSENRWDAINPQGTWMDLRHALAGSDVPKSAWIGIMYTFALDGGNANRDEGRLPPDAITNGFASSVAGEVDTELSEIFKNHSSINYCDPVNGSTTDVDVFHIQGAADTLFNFNDGFDNALCMKNSGNDVRFLSVLGGHLLPAISPPHHSGEVGMSLDEVVHCGRDASGNPIQLSVRDMIVDWFEEKLRFQDGAADYIPEVCIVQENLDGGVLVSPEYSGPGTLLTSDQAEYASRFAVEGITSPEPEQILAGAASATNSMAGLDDVIVGKPTAGEYSWAFTGEDYEWSFEGVNLITTPALSQTAFVCLHQSDGGELVVGMPTMQLSATSTPVGTAVQSLISTLTGPTPVAGGTPIFYAGIGVRRASDRSWPDCLDENDAPVVSLSVETSAGAADTFLGQVLDNPLTKPVLEGLLDAAGLTIGNNASELLHDQLTAIKGTVVAAGTPPDIETKFPYEFPDNYTRANGTEADAYPWQLGDIGVAKPEENKVGFGCAPNTSAIDGVSEDSEDDVCSDYGGFGRLAGVSARLLPGDQVGLYLFGSSLQYAFSSDTVPDLDLTIQGKIRLPIIPEPGPQPVSAMVGPKAN